MTELSQAATELARPVLAGHAGMMRIALWVVFLQMMMSTSRGDDAFTLGPTAPAASQPAVASTDAPLSAPAIDPDRATVEAGLAEFFATRFSAHEPIYFLAGPSEPEAKFQISLKYQLFNPEGTLVRQHPWLSDLYLAYSQTSFWDLGESNSSPFFDSSYRPEALYQVESPGATWLGQSRFDFQAGVRHESNGRSGLESRSLNIAYLRPIFTWGDDGTHGSRDFFIAVAPRLWAYAGDLDDNEDIYQYRGYGDLKVIVGWRGGLQLSAMARIGNDFDRGALQLDLTYPLRALSSKNVDLYLDAQLFTGYGESLLEYDQSETNFRIGVALVR